MSAVSRHLRQVTAWLDPAERENPFSVVDLLEPDSKTTRSEAQS